MKSKLALMLGMSALNLNETVPFKGKEEKAEKKNQDTVMLEAEKKRERKNKKRLELAIKWRGNLCCIDRAASKKEL